MNSYGSKINDTLLASNEEERYISVSLIFEIDRIEDVKKFKELFGISLEVLSEFVSTVSVSVEYCLGRRIYVEMDVKKYVPSPDSSSRETVNVASDKEQNLGEAEKTTIPKKLFVSSSFQAEKLEVPKEISFSSGIPAHGTVKGLLHLYKPSSTDDLSSGPSDKICLFGIPTSLSCSDLLTFLAPANENINCLQIVRESSPNHYLALLSFKDTAASLDFYKCFNGRRYNSFEDHVCHTVFVSKIGVKHKTEGAALPIAGTTELPSCPVCLERLDEPLNGILTILCNHSFHIECLTKWKDNSCPVCRYCQSPESSEGNTCGECDSIEDLWICLICGHVGCGRYGGGHAHDHFLHTQHTFTMQVGTQRVWDYVGDNYVHRLVQNKTDGKIVQVEGSGQYADDEKLDSLQLEYTYLLTSQLESQRIYFEEKLALIEEESLKQVETVEARCKTAISACERLEGIVSELEREKKTLAKKCANLQGRIDKESEALKEERELNKALTANQDKWKERCVELEVKMETEKLRNKKDVQDLQDQVKDLMFYLDTQKKVDESQIKQDIQEGHVVVTQSSIPSKKAKKKHK